MLPVYVINLDRRPDRWSVISTRCRCLGINVTRITAVDVQLLTLQEKREVFPFEKELEIGGAAIVMSHCKALKAFLETQYPAALILEDDVELSSDLPSVLQSVDWWPSDSKVVKLEGSIRPRYLGRSIGLTPKGRRCHPIVWASAYAGAYLIDRSGAEIVLAEAMKTGMTADSMLFHIVGSPVARKLRPVHVVPAMAYQRREFGSDNTATRSPRKIGPFGRFLSKVKVLIFQAIGLVQHTPVPYQDKY